MKNLCAKNPEAKSRPVSVQGLPPLQLTGVTFDKVVKKDDDAQRACSPGS